MSNYYESTDKNGRLHTHYKRGQHCASPIPDPIWQKRSEWMEKTYELVRKDPGLYQEYIRRKIFEFEAPWNILRDIATRKGWNMPDESVDGGGRSSGSEIIETV